MPQLPKESVLDLVVGGSLLPHVYCTKITVDKYNGSATTKMITVNFEIYEEQKNLANSQWLQTLTLPGSQGGSLLDALFIQILPIVEKENFDRLKASRNPNGATIEGSPHRSSIYLAHMLHGDGYLPRAPDELNSSKNPNVPFLGPYFPVTPAYLEIDWSNPTPIKVSTSSLLGNLNSADALSGLVSEGKITEKIIGKKVYYVVPFQYHFIYEQGAHSQLGLLFYCYLSVAGWLKSLGGDMEGLLPSSLMDYEALILEGPVNTEIIYEPGNKIAEKRETFLQPGGDYWEGSVHYHGTGNPAPDGYTGWMAGSAHKTSVKQPKLQLIEVPNYKVADNSVLTNNIIADPPDQGISGFGVDYQVGLGPGYEAAQDVINYFSANFVLKPTTQYETLRKHFSRDNDNEYSNLYVCRDKDNNARGMFFINFRNMLNNNSHLFHCLTEFGRTQAINSVLAKSKIIELRVLRDRVEKNHLQNGVRNFENDEVYEEAPYLVGTLSDVEKYKSVSNNTEIMEISLDSSQDSVRYFMFSDTDVGHQESGLYQYRVEVQFQDGTYELVQGWLKNLERARAQLGIYYDLAISGDNVGSSPGSYQQLGGFQNSSENYDKTFFKPYYDASTNSFRDEFLIAAMNLKELDYDFGGINYYIWEAVPHLIDQAQALFLKTDPKQQMWTGMWMKLVLMIYPGAIGGSPQGIELVLKILNGWIQKLQSITKSIKRKSTGSELNSVAASAVKNYTRYGASPSRSIIYESHTFDHPSQLFAATANQDVYMDYLSVGDSLFTNFYGLRSLTKDYYQKRCWLDAIKFSPMAVTENGFKTATGPTNIALKYSMGPEPTYDGEISFEDSAYGYLTPSILELSDPGVKNLSFDYYYSVFNKNAWFALQNPSKPFFNADPRGPFSTGNAMKLLVSLVNYNFNKTDIDFADLSNAYYDMQNSLGFDDATMNNFGGVMSHFIQRREPVKNLFDNVSLTLHEQEKHDFFFKKPSGFIDTLFFPPPLNAAANQSYPPNIQEDFSDGVLLSDNYFNNIMFSALQNVVKIPRGTDGQDAGGLIGASSYKNLPNSFKMKKLYNNRKALGETPSLYVQPKFLGVFANDIAATTSAFKYLNFNLTAHIEVFKLHDQTYELSKNDVPSWTTLQKSHISSLGPQEKLFCRIKYYDDSLVHGINTPVLDRYFLISENATTGVPAAPAPAISISPGSAGDMSIDKGDLDFWRGQNQKTVEKLKNMTEKGKKMVSGRDPTVKSGKPVHSADRADEPYRVTPLTDQVLNQIKRSDEEASEAPPGAVPPAGAAKTATGAVVTTTKLDLDVDIAGPVGNGGDGGGGGGGYL